MKSWKTTLFGLVMGVAGLFASGQVPSSPQAQKIAGLVVAVAGAGLGATAKDHDVTGGKKEQ